MGMIGINTTALMMLLRCVPFDYDLQLGSGVQTFIIGFRVTAMYSRKPDVVWGVAVAFCIEFSVNAWLAAHGTRAYTGSLVRLFVSEVLSTAVVHHQPIHCENASYAPPLFCSPHLVFV